MSPCQDCRCGAGQGRGCKLRQPRNLTRTEWALIIVLAIGWALAGATLWVGGAR